MLEGLSTVTVQPYTSRDDDIPVQHAASVQQYEDNVDNNFGFTLPSMYLEPITVQHARSAKKKRRKRASRTEMVDGIKDGAK